MLAQRADERRDVVVVGVERRLRREDVRLAHARARPRRGARAPPAPATSHVFPSATTIAGRGPNVSAKTSATGPSTPEPIRTASVSEAPRRASEMRCSLIHRRGRSTWSHHAMRRLLRRRVQVLVAVDPEAVLLVARRVGLDRAPEADHRLRRGREVRWIPAPTWPRSSPRRAPALRSPS